MTTPPRRLFFEEQHITIDERIERIYDAKTGERVAAVAYQPPVIVEVDVRELTGLRSWNGPRQMPEADDSQYWSRIERAVESVVDKNYRTGEVNGYVVGPESLSPVAGYVYMPVQFYRVGGR